MQSDIILCYRDTDGKSAHPTGLDESWTPIRLADVQALIRERDEALEALHIEQALTRGLQSRAEAAERELARWTQPHDPADLQAMREQCETSPRSMGAAVAYIMALRHHLAHAERKHDEARAEVERLRALGEAMAAGIEALCSDPDRERWDLLCDPLDAWRAAGGES